MSLDLSFHNVTALKAEAKIERRSQYVDLQIIPAAGAPTEITIHFDSKAKAQRFATAINYAASQLLIGEQFEKHYAPVLAEAGKAVEEETARTIQSMRDNPKPPPLPKPRLEKFTYRVDDGPLRGAAHADAFAIQDEYERDCRLEEEGHAQ